MYRIDDLNYHHSVLLLFAYGLDRVPEEKYLYPTVHNVYVRVDVINKYANLDINMYVHAKWEERASISLWGFYNM